MTSVTVKNTGPGLRSFKNADKQDVVIQPGDSRVIEMHPYHVLILEREAAKKDATITITVAEDDVVEYKDEIDAIRKANVLGRKKKRVGGVRQPTADRAPRVDTRFIVDPKNPEVNDDDDKTGGQDEGENLGPAKPKRKRGQKRVRV